MEKISSIIPSNSRIKSVDMTDSAPVRPGAPAFGRPEGTVSVKDRFTLSQNAPDQALKETLTYKNPREVARSKMVEEINKKFFDTRVGQPKVEEVATEPAAFEPTDVNEKLSAIEVESAPQETVEKEISLAAF